jgi:hypothetical protein
VRVATTARARLAGQPPCAAGDHQHDCGSTAEAAAAGQNHGGEVVGLIPR